MGKLKVLIITPSLPYPLNAGGNIAQFYMIDGLKDQVDFSIISFNASEENCLKFKEQFPAIQLINIKRSATTKFIAHSKLRIKNKISVVSNPLKIFTERNIRWSKTKNWVLNKLKKIDFSKYDLVQFEFLESAPYKKQLDIKVPSVLIHHELRYIRSQRMLDVEKYSESEKKVAVDQIKKVEISKLDDFENVIVFSPVDQSLLTKELPKTKIHISQFAFPVLTSSRKKDFENKIVFVGSESHFPNKDGLNWFLLTVWPNVGKDCKLYVTGKWSAAFTRKFESQQQIVFTGFVEDLHELLLGSIMIVPLRIGSGVRTKIIEAFSLRVPVMTTSIGVEGIDAKNNVHCFIEDDSEKFAEKLNQIKKKNLTEITSNAHRLYNETYKIEVCSQKRLKVLEKIAVANLSQQTEAI